LREEMAEKETAIQTATSLKIIKIYVLA